MSNYRASLKNGQHRLDLDEKNDRCCSRHRHGRVQNDAQRATVRIGIDRVNMGHLDDGEQAQQRQAQQHPCQSATLLAKCNSVLLELYQFITLS